MNHKALYPWTLIKACASGPIAHSRPAPCTDLPTCPLKACCVSPPGPVSNKCLYFTFPSSLLLNLELTIHDTLGLYLTNVNLTKKSHLLVQ